MHKTAAFPQQIAAASILSEPLHHLHSTYADVVWQKAHPDSAVIKEDRRASAYGGIFIPEPSCTASLEINIGQAEPIVDLIYPERHRSIIAMSTVPYRLKVCMLLLGDEAFSSPGPVLTSAVMVVFA
ncbi:hypothetical protein Baya_15891 [Bagarius yarrelli]|uniref:Uncharacterized protein n=1 Tax=Bagarius yarrelli TaxID=175774 RepID=A0A556VK88_BAGYA|nr:hypothetical protein Baya_15891 [Bagarius yarrelli]